MLARRRLPRLVFDFVDGAAGREIAAAKNISAFDEIELQPRVMQDVSSRNLRTTFLGSEYDCPVGIAPMGMCDLIWHGADRMLARASNRFNAPLCLSSAASCLIEDMLSWTEGRAWFQLYVGQSMDHTLDMVERAKTAGYETLVLTVDVPQVSRRVRDLRNGFEMPFRIGPRQFLDFAAHPKWSLTTLVNGAPSAKNFPTDRGNSGFDRGASRAGADWAFLNRLRDLWPGRLVIKGVTSVADAKRIQSCGADAIYVSNHGGRQLDSAPAAIKLLPAIRTALGPDYPLIFDSGIRSGEDVVKALAFGADFVMLGRPLLFAIGAEGERGLNSLFSIFTEEISLTLAQLGLTRPGEISRDVLINPPASLTEKSTQLHITKSIKRA
ncbi:alpha-hydroxy acid oxidase [Hoeflea sp. TYP-13]